MYKLDIGFNTCFFASACRQNPGGEALDSRGCCLLAKDTGIPPQEGPKFR